MQRFTTDSHLIRLIGLSCLLALAAMGLGCGDDIAGPSPTSLHINSVTPSTGQPGDRLVLMGRNLTGATAVVTFAGPNNTRIPATVNSGTDTTLNVTVPPGAISGSIDVSPQGKPNRFDVIAFTVGTPPPGPG